MRPTGSSASWILISEKEGRFPPHGDDVDVQDTQHRETGHLPFPGAEWLALLNTPGRLTLRCPGVFSHRGSFRKTAGA